ncbi:hypothetical protein [Kitasatospora sp. MBT63]|uniref:hypothetical protein n=1 Tax=Kitasatospora sp. MBT63 TaxID=1444768 RepID=UPI00053B3C50|nr:hypothetical protein [Kitasatospora sp. MBT63]
MTGDQTAVEQTGYLDPARRLRAGALLLVRYCGIHSDPRFSPWFERERDVLAGVVETARAAVRGRAGRTDFEQLRAGLDDALESSDPEGPPFQAEIFDHLVFATGVLDVLRAPEDADALNCAPERADELAEAHDGMAQECGPAGGRGGAVLGALETEARRLDVSAGEDPVVALARSEEFAAAYARSIAAYYTDADAGIGA